MSQYMVSTFNDTVPQSPMGLHVSGPAAGLPDPAAGTVRPGQEEPVRFVTLVGNPKAGSRTSNVAQAATWAVMAAADRRDAYETVDLSALACRLPLPQASAVIEDAVEEVLGADVLLVASPVFKGTYTGLLKVFLDRLGYRALASTLALPMLVMKHPEHALAVEVHMRPLLVELGASEADTGALSW